MRLSVTLLLIWLMAFQPCLAQEITKIAFGSCSHQDKPLNILATIALERPHAMLWLGDNIYGDTDNIAVLQSKYKKLGNNKNFIALRETTPFYTIWDDHDFGKNDGGKEFDFKFQSAVAFLDFWQVAQNDPRRKQQDGIYHSVMLNGPAGRTIQIIFPDLRFNRDPISAVDEQTYRSDRQAKKMGPYLPDQTATMSMLGSTQWLWFENELKKPADIKIIASSLQILAAFTGWEAWKNYPYDAERLFSLVSDLSLDNLVLISGDTHWAEISKQTIGQIELVEVTSSGLSEKWKDVSPNQYRVSPSYYQNNYGLIEIAWQEKTASLTLGFKNIQGNFVAKETLIINLTEQNP